ncbi:hypothetical protein TNCV_5065721 [Trichonephila clavipes]|nr:hypothetical protein TNCV_5065721 [Trichonephila clavipes]
MTVIHVYAYVYHRTPSLLIQAKGGSRFVRFEHDFAASKATDHDVVGDEIETNSANPQTLVVENQHINPPEEPEHF